MNFLLYILLIYLLIWLLRPLFGRLLRLFINNRTQSFFNQAMGGYASAGQRTSRQDRQRQQSSSRRRKKVFERGEGEYVEFEEVVEPRQSATSERVESRDSVIREEQVTDAEWVEL
jgi:hypothetical protein